jgi:hypothetical protein
MNDVVRLHQIAQMARRAKTCAVTHAVRCASVRDGIVSTDPLSELYRLTHGSAEGRDEAIDRYAFAVPCEEALEAVVAAAPHGVVEVGAGTGYWARLLDRRGIEVVAFDAAPAPSPTNSWFSRAERWFTVHTGDASEAARFPERCLLIVWPTRNETWAGEALAGYYTAGGETVVYVGEPPGGQTGDDLFHRRLGTLAFCAQCRWGDLDRPCVCGVDPLFEQVLEVPIPTWAGCVDRLSIHHRVRPRTVRRWRGAMRS